jgi:hypothetical protein
MYTVTPGAVNREKCVQCNSADALRRTDQGIVCTECAVVVRGSMRTPSVTFTSKMPALPDALVGSAKARRFVRNGNDRTGTRGAPTPLITRLNRLNNACMSRRRKAVLKFERALHEVTHAAKEHNNRLKSACYQHFNAVVRLDDMPKLMNDKDFVVFAAVMLVHASHDRRLPLPAFPLKLMRAVLEHRVGVGTAISRMNADAKFIATHVVIKRDDTPCSAVHRWSRWIGELPLHTKAGADPALGALFGYRRDPGTRLLKKLVAYTRHVRFPASCTVHAISAALLWLTVSLLNDGKSAMNARVTNCVSSPAKRLVALRVMFQHRHFVAAGRTGIGKSAGRTKLWNRLQKRPGSGTSASKPDCTESS